MLHRQRVHITHHHRQIVSKLIPRNGSLDPSSVLPVLHPDISHDNGGLIKSDIVGELNI